MTEEITQDATQTTQNSDSLLDTGADAPAVGNADPATAGAKPDWLADDLWDAEKNSLKSDAALKKIQDADRHEKMAKDMRDKLARRGPPPEKADDYKINIDDKPWKDKVALPPAIMDKVRAKAFELGVPQSHFGPLAEAYLEALAEVGGQEQEATPEQLADIEAQREQFKAAELSKLGKNANEVTRAVSGMVRDLKAQGLFTDDHIDVIKSMANTAAGVQALNVFRELIGGNHLPMIDADPASNGMVSHGTIQDLMNTPEYTRGDAGVVEKVERMIDQTIKAGNPFKYIVR